MRLSVLDLVPVRTDQTTADALSASTSLARVADAAGYTRYWVAEHHNAPMVASTSPSVVIAHLAASTSRIRVGSGGVMLPNHAPLAVAEQFALLEAMHPARIDLGIGRAPGTDPVTAWALRGPAGRDDSDIAMFPQYLDDIVALMGRRGVAVPLPGGTHTLRATPAAAGEATLWLLGSSMYSARLAAEKGLPYVFAHHFSGLGTAEALAHYRAHFRPSDLAAEPTTLLTVNASVAATHEEALALAVPQMIMMARLRGGLPLGPLELLEEAAASRERLPAAAVALVDEGLGRCVIGDPGQAAAQVTALAERFGVDEVMINPIGSAHRGVAADLAPAREEALMLLAKDLLGG
jgi:luciferase family oxidoreductase group 1